MNLTRSESRCFAEYENHREAEAALDGPGWISCTDCGREAHEESGAVVVVLGEVRCNECAISMLTTEWTSAGFALRSPAERLEILDAIETLAADEQRGIVVSLRCP